MQRPGVTLLQGVRSGARAARRRSTTASAPAQPSEAAAAAWQHYAELSRTAGSIQYSSVNKRYVPPLSPLELPTTQPVDNAMGRMSDKHLKEEWSEEEIAEAVRDNVVMTWSGSASRTSMPRMVRGEGVYLYDSTGKGMFSEITIESFGIENLKGVFIENFLIVNFVTCDLDTCCGRGVPEPDSTGTTQRFSLPWASILEEATVVEAEDTV